MKLPVNFDYQASPQTVFNHLQSQGKEPLTMLAHQYPPPAHYSPLQTPPAHIQAHRTEVKSFMSPPVFREEFQSRIIQKNPSPQTVLRPGTPVFGNNQQ